MSVGNPQTLNDWNGNAGAIAVQLREILHRVEVYADELSRITDADLEALGMASGDVSVLRSAVADMLDLATVFKGGASGHLTGTYDYTQFVGLLYGCI